MNVSIIICTKDRPKSLQMTLEALSSINLAEHEVELLVVDNASKSPVEPLVSAFTPSNRMKVRYVFEATPGHDYALNCGIAHASGDAIVFTDDDVLPSKNWLCELIAPLDHGEADAVAGASTLHPDLCFEWMSKSHYAFLAVVSPNDQEWFMLTGVNMAVHRRVLDYGIRFDPDLGPGRLGFCGDLLFTDQVRHAGFRLKAVPSASVVHCPDVSRLSFDSWRDRVIKEGACRAYVSYHWGGYRLRTVPVKLLQVSIRRIQLWLSRKLSSKTAEHPTEEELNVWGEFSYFLKLFSYLGRTRKYAATIDMNQ